MSSLWLRKLAVAPIRFYQYCLSPLFPARCRFYPTCSAYAREAVLRHGLLKGGLLAVYRILRCNPWCAGGYDPVPPAQGEKPPDSSTRGSHSDP
jgi:putative membrane protein insertion efficiency factor